MYKQITYKVGSNIPLYPTPITLHCPYCKEYHTKSLYLGTEYPMSVKVCVTCNRDKQIDICTT
mgnify:CR=1 FL=1